MTTTHVLTIDADRLVAHSRTATASSMHVFDTLEQVTAFLTDATAAGEPVMASSSLDFPEESTTNAHVIAMCKALRG